MMARVGEGSFGKVYKGRMKYTGQIVALKFIKKGGKTAEEVKQIREEIDIMKELKHDNIVRMLDAFETSGEFCVVTEYAQVCGNLRMMKCPAMVLI